MQAYYSQLFLLYRSCLAKDDNELIQVKLGTIWARVSWRQPCELEYEDCPGSNPILAKVFFCPFYFLGMFF